MSEENFGTFDEKYAVQCISATPIYNNIVFTKDNNTIGTLCWDDGIMKFDGNAEESAKIFFDYFCKLFNKK